ncbi:MAG TPA: nuclear transport factor 2 family protein [Acetobacteraceae bacterium]|nr:nuclear transport factor 2 family protein [Acetobacteraceae bacterium]
MTALLPGANVTVSADAITAAGNQGETMPIIRRQLAAAGTGLLCAAAFGSTAFAAASGGTDAVAAAVEAYRVGLLNADGKLLNALCTDPIAYGHSTGRVQTRKEFLDEAGNGKSVWKTIGFSDLSILLNGGNAMSRFVFNGVNEVNGKQNTLRFGVLIVWVRQRGKWKLLARQGYKI